jgi:hypothetical protein
MKKYHIRAGINEYINTMTFGLILYSTRVTISTDYKAEPFISSSLLDLCLLYFKSISDGKPVLFMLGIRTTPIGPHLVEK